VINRNRRVGGMNPSRGDTKAGGHRVYYRRVFVGS
jgi:hypothetical protein